MNIEDQFSQFVLSKQKLANEASSTDWIRRKIDFLTYIDGLYIDVARYLEPFLDNGSIVFGSEEVVIHELDVGKYVTRSLIIKVGNLTYTMTPVGTNATGVKGRVDIECCASKARLVLVDAEPGQPSARFGMFPEKTEGALTWKVSTMPPRISFIDFNKDVLFDVMMEIGDA